jgi:hypothetical protein
MSTGTDHSSQQVQQRYKVLMAIARVQEQCITVSACHVRTHIYQAQARSAASFQSATSVRSATSDGLHLQQVQASPRRAQGGRTGRTRAPGGVSDQGLIWKAKISI